MKLKYFDKTLVRSRNVLLIAVIMSGRLYRFQITNTMAVYPAQWGMPSVTGRLLVGTELTALLPLSFKKRGGREVSLENTIHVSSKN